MGRDGEAGSGHPSGRSGPGELAVYDSFVVRMWRTPGVDLVRRVEVEHVQSGVIASAGNVGLTWIVEQLCEAWEDARRESGEGHGTRDKG